MGAHGSAIRRPVAYLRALNQVTRRIHIFLIHQEMFDKLNLTDNGNRFVLA